MPSEKQAFEFVVEHTERGWMVLGGLQTLGPFSQRNMPSTWPTAWAVMRAMGDAVAVRVED
jgi:hypothetical protein